MDKYELEKIIEKKYNTLYTDLETLFSTLSDISGTVQTIRELNYLNKKIIPNQKIRE